MLMTSERLTDRLGEARNKRRLLAVSEAKRGKPTLSGASEGNEERRKGVNDMRKHGNGLEVGRAGTMEVKATKGAESTKAPKKQTGGDLRSKSK